MVSQLFVFCISFSAITFFFWWNCVCFRIFFFVKKWREWNCERVNTLSFESTLKIFIDFWIVHYLLFLFFDVILKKLSLHNEFFW